MADEDQAVTTQNPDPEWRTDCARCFGLCCVAFAHNPTAGFPRFKATDTPCVHLGLDFRCRVFANLEAEGFSVCRPYDCFGAGPVVADRMRRDRADWTPDTVANAKRHLDGFRELSRLCMVIVALRRHGGAEAEELADHLGGVAEGFRETGRVDIDVETSQMLRWHEDLISAILKSLEGQTEDRGAS